MFGGAWAQKGWEPLVSRSVRIAKSLLRNCWDGDQLWDDNSNCKELDNHKERFFWLHELLKLHSIFCFCNLIYKQKNSKEITICFHKMLDWTSVFNLFLRRTNKSSFFWFGIQVVYNLESKKSLIWLKLLVLLNWCTAWTGLVYHRFRSAVLHQ